jgi:hypothetical protein
LGYFGRAHVRVTSSPSGGVVLVDGKPAPVATPLLISGLSTAREHLIEVRLPGMKPWTRKFVPVRGRMLSLHANLEWNGMESRLR